MAAGKEVIPQAELDVIVDMPADLLRRRPDVRAAEMQMAAQSALIGVSAADLYPSISLLGSVGLSATSLGSSTRALTWALGPSLVWNVFDHGRLTNAVLLQDARFQQLYEQYQDAVLRAAREVDDAAVGFAKTGEQIVLLADAVKAAQRSLDIATLQYREGLTDFQRVLDSQRVLFSQQELLVTSRGSLTQNLIALYKAMGGGWEQGRSRPVLDDATRETMSRRSDWKGLLTAPLPPPGADARPTLPERQDHEPRIRQAGRDHRRRRANVARRRRSRRQPARATAAAAKPGKGSALGAIIVLILIVASLAWYFVADRLTPYTSQARVQAFVVPVAAEVSGKVLKVHVKNNDEVQPGQPLFDIDPAPYQIALQRSRSDYESVRLSVNAANAAVDAAKASLQAAKANRMSTPSRTRRGSNRSIRRIPAPSRCAASRVRRPPDQGAQPGGGCGGGPAPRAGDGGRSGDKNAQLISARSAIEKAELDLKRTQVRRSRAAAW